MKTALIPFIQSDLEVVLSESPRFRFIVAGILVSQGNLVQAAKTQLDMLRDYIAAHFDKDSRIPAIKYVRQWATDNAHPDLQSLAGAKEFICNLIPYPAS